MIESLRCKNFKCFHDTGDINLAPITLIVGKNNSGKSSILQALYLPALTLQSEDPNTCLKLLHKDYDYGSFSDIVFQHDERKLITLSFKTIIGIKILNDKKQNSGEKEITLQLTYSYLLRRREIHLHKFVIKDSDGEMFTVSPNKYKDSQKVLIREHEDEVSYISHLFHRRSFFFQPRFNPYNTFNRLKHKYGEKKALELLDYIYNEYLIVDGFTASFYKIDFLGPSRPSPRRAYLFSGELTNKIGPKGESALQNYATLIKRGKKEDKEKVQSINNALYQLGFIKKIEEHKIGRRYYEFSTQHKESGLSANWADTGFGASQVLPVIVSLYTSPPGSTLLYEQPEIHLHPAAQAELGSIFVKARSPKKKIVIETHSENLILRIQTEVAKGTLKPEDVKIYYIQPDSKGHKVILIPLDEKGEFLIEWPKGFFEEGYQESLKLSKARHRE